MLPVHALVSLAAAKDALRIRQADTQMDSRIEGIIEEATDWGEQIAGRRFIFRGGGEPDDAQISTGPLADGPLAVTTPGVSNGPFCVQVAWTRDPAPTDETATVTVVGSSDSSPVTLTFSLDVLRSAFNGAALMDTVNSVTISAKTGTSEPPIAVTALYPYVEVHQSNGMKHLYTNERPVKEMLKVEEGAYEAFVTGWLEVPESQYRVNDVLGKVIRSTRYQGFVDFPEDYYFRYPQRYEQGLGSWAPDGRLTYFGGEWSYAPLTGVLKSLALETVAGIYREREGKLQITDSESNSAGSQSIGKWREELEKRWMGEMRHSDTGEGRIG